MLKTLTAAGFIAAASLFVGGLAQAETTGGTTMGGGDNGAAAKTDSTAKAQTGTTTGSGSPAATPAPGQSTEKPNGEMRGSKNF